MLQGMLLCAIVIIGLIFNNRSKKKHSVIEQGEIIKYSGYERKGSKIIYKYQMKVVYKNKVRTFLYQEAYNLEGNSRVLNVGSKVEVYYDIGMENAIAKDDLDKQLKVYLIILVIDLASATLLILLMSIFFS